MTGWLARADEDLAAAKILLAGSLPSWDTSSFHSQQAAEKTLKALLTRHQVAFPRTHDIAELLELAEPCVPGISGALATARALTTYAVDTRYPGGKPVSKAEATRHAEIAEGVSTYVRQQLATYLTAGRPT